MMNPLVAAGVHSSHRKQRRNPRGLGFYRGRHRRRIVYDEDGNPTVVAEGLYRRLVKRETGRHVASKLKEYTTNLAAFRTTKGETSDKTSN